MSSVIHHTNAFRFEIDIDSTEIDTDSAEKASSAHLTYEVLDNRNINFTHTFVPFRQRGKGYAEELVKVGLDWARENDLLISSSCWYVDKYMAEHPE
ncbi:MAG: putative GNAT family acetyltransferase [Bermanella sp.]|jgi:predicted GNAT family acetyltransferase